MKRKAAVRDDRAAAFLWGHATRMGVERRPSAIVSVASRAIGGVHHATASHPMETRKTHGIWRRCRYLDTV